MKPTVLRVSRVVVAALGLALTAFAAEAWDDSHRHGNRNSGAHFGLGFSQSGDGAVSVGGYISDGQSRRWDRDQDRRWDRDDGRRWDRDEDWRWNRHGDRRWDRDGRRWRNDRYGGFNGVIIWQSGPARPAWYRSPYDRFPSSGYVYYSSPRVIAWAVLPAFVYDRLSTRSRGYHEQSYWRAMSAPIGQQIEWNDGINAGRIATTRDGYAGTQYCREFQQSITVGGRREQAYGTACQEPDGSWRLVESQ